MNKHIVSNSEKIVLHLGLCKTGTTFLQRRFFPNLKYANTCGFTDSDLNRYILHSGEYTFNPKTATLYFHNLSLQSNDPLKIILSSEGFSGNPWDGGQTRKRTAERLASVFPEATVMVVFRKPAALLESLYCQYVQCGGTLTRHHFLRHKQHPVNINPDYFAYGSYLKHLQDLFGDNHVHAYFFEDLKSNPENFLNQMCLDIGLTSTAWNKKILGMQENVSLRPPMLNVMRFLNQFMSSPWTPTDRTSGKTQTLARRLLKTIQKLFFSKKSHSALPKTAIIDFFSDCDNEILLLEKLTGRDLQPLGYK